MKILVVSHAPTHPTNAGNRIRILALARTLLDLGHEVHFAYIPMNAVDETEMRSWWGERFHRLRYEKPRQVPGALASLARRIEHTFFPENRYPMNVDAWFDPQLLPQLRELHRTQRFSAVMVEYVFMSRALEAFPDEVLKVIDTHDVFTDRHKHFLRAGLEPSWFTTTRRQEARGLRRAHTVLAIQEKERNFLQGISAVNTVTVGHLLSIERHYHGGQPAGKGLFVGSSNQVNVDSFRQFLETTWPLILHAMPTARLLLAGQICAKVPDHSAIDKLGEVPDLSTVYAQADVVIAPIYFGTGLNIKVIEALGHGMPVVTTPAGAKGIAPTDALLIAETPESFAGAVARVISDPKTAAHLSNTASAFAGAWNNRQISALSAIFAA